MARALVVVLGLVLGILTGTGLVLGSPLAWFRGLPPLPADLAPAKAYRWDNYRGIEGGVADLLGLGRRNPHAATCQRPQNPQSDCGLA